MANAPQPPNLVGPNAPEVEAAFQAAPPECVAEILDGTLSLMPRPRPVHARATSRLLPQFDSYDHDPQGWIFLIEPEVHLGPRPDKLVPDIAGWRRARMPELPDEAAITLAPDWVCEVISPSTERIDRGKKMRIYRREKVGHVWLVSPQLQTVEVYRREGEAWLLLETYEGDARVRAEPFDAVEVDLALLWEK